MLEEKYFELVLEKGINPEIGLDASALDNTSYAVFREYADAIKKRGLSVTFHAPFVDLSPGSIDPEIRAVSRHRLEQVLRLVPLFHPKTVVCHTGYETLRHGYMLDQWIENSLEQWRWFSERLVAEGARLMLENVFEAGPEDFFSLFSAIGHKGVGFCLDVGHQMAFSRSSLEKWLDVLGPFLGQLHLHDNNGKGDDHLAMGQGRVEFDVLFRFLKETARERPLITLEPHVDADLWPSLEYLKKHWIW